MILYTIILHPGSYAHSDWVHLYNLLSAPISSPSLKWSIENLYFEYTSNFSAAEVAEAYENNNHDYDNKHHVCGCKDPCGALHNETIHTRRSFSIFIFITNSFYRQHFSRLSSKKKFKRGDNYFLSTVLLSCLVRVTEMHARKLLHAGRESFVYVQLSPVAHLSYTYRNNSNTFLKTFTLISLLWNKVH